MKNTHRNTPVRLWRGFTLMEMILVLAIIALLTGLAVFALKGTDETAKIVAARANISTFETTLQEYKIVGARLPTQNQGLGALVRKPTSPPPPKAWHRYLRGDEALIDPWGEAYVYRNPGRMNPDGYDVFSKGKDLVADTDDDIGNW